VGSLPGGGESTVHQGTQRPAGELPGSGEAPHGKSPFLIGKSTISMAMFNSYVELPEGIC